MSSNDEPAHDDCVGRAAGWSRAPRWQARGSGRPLPTLDVAVVGATGAVGEVLLDQLAASRLPIRRLLPLASERSAGASVVFGDEPIAVEAACPEAFEGIDLVFFAATGALSKSLAPEAVARGAVVIDKSSSWRMDPGVPLVIPEINAEALAGHRGIVANPNCTTTGVVMALAPIDAAVGISRVVITTFQAVSGAGRPGLEELAQQKEAARTGEALKVEQFAAPIADNVVPLCGRLSGLEGIEAAYTDEELKLRDETRKILGLPDLEVEMTCVRVPVPVGHSASILVETERPLSASEARQALADFPGVRVCEDDAFPTPHEGAGRDEIYVGRVRPDLSGRGLWLWQVGDNIRKGAATNARQIAEVLHGRALI